MARRRRPTTGEDHYYSTEQMGWLLGVSADAVRERIKAGEIDGVRLPAGFRVRRDEALRVSRERVERETGQRLSDGELQRLVDETIATNEAGLEG